MILIFKLMGILFYGISMLSTKLTGPLLTFLGACCVYCIITRSWRDVLILASCISIVYLFYFLGGLLLGVLKTAEGNLTNFLHA